MAKTYQLAVLWMMIGVLALMPAETVRADDLFDEPPQDLFGEEEQVDPFGGDNDASAKAAGTDPTAEKPGDKINDKPNGESIAPPVVSIKPRFIRLHLKDGSVIAGELSSPHISVTTEFGPLKIPIDKIVSFRPGLNSYPDLAAKINKLFEELGSTEYRARERSYKELLAYGDKIQNLLEQYDSDSNLERKNRVSQIRKEMDELRDDDDEFELGPADRPWNRDDWITTTRFTIVGKIDIASFRVESKYGPLSVKLSDVQHAERPLSGRVEVRKSIEVSGANLVQRVWKSTGVRVTKGDEIMIRADGQITMTPWGNKHSTPDGGTQFGWYVQNQIAGGALCAKIGEQGETIKVGGRAKFVAKRSGILKFGVAMVPNYAQQNYNFPGHYDVQVKVRPK